MHSTATTPWARSSREGLDVGANGTLDLASSDRITERGYTFFTASSAWWKRETTTTYATASSSTATQLGKVETQLSGLRHQSPHPHRQHRHLRQCDLAIR
jgi:hypothetical protein